MDATPTCLSRPPSGSCPFYAAFVFIVLMAFGVALPAQVQADPPPPQVESISPDHGPLAGGTLVTIIGSGFTEATGVKFGHADAESFAVESDTEITAISPEANGAVNSGYVGDVTVIGPGGTSQETAADLFAYGPIINQMEPISGPAAGGTSVTFSGFSLEDTSAVNFGSVPAESFTVNPNGSITAVAPPRVPDETLVRVTATTPEGTSHTPKGADERAANVFAYGPTITSVTPNEGPAAGGTEITMHGTGFESNLFFCLCGPFVNRITFGPAELKCGTPFGLGTPGCSPLEFEVKSDTEITATVPPGTGTVSVTINTFGGTSPANSAAQFSYTGVPPPGPPEEPQVLQLLNCSVQAGTISVCSGRSVDASAVDPIAGPTARLYRGKTLYAKGTARVHRSHSRLLLDPVRSLAPGRYMLVLSRPGNARQGSNWPRREPVIVK